MEKFSQYLKVAITTTITTAGSGSKHFLLHFFERIRLESRIIPIFIITSKGEDKGTVISSWVSAIRVMSPGRSIRLSYFRIDSHNGCSRIRIFIYLKGKSQGHCCNSTAWHVRWCLAQHSQLSRQGYYHYYITLGPISGGSCSFKAALYAGTEKGGLLWG